MWELIVPVSEETAFVKVPVPPKRMAAGEARVTETRPPKAKKAFAFTPVVESDVQTVDGDDCDNKRMREQEKKGAGRKKITEPVNRMERDIWATQPKVRPWTVMLLPPVTALLR